MQTRPIISLLIAAVSVLGMNACNDLNIGSSGFNQSVLCNLTVNATKQGVYLFRTTSVDDPGPIPNYFFFFPEVNLNDLRFIPYFIDHATVSMKDEPQNVFPFELSIDTLNGVVVGKSFKNRDTFNVRPRKPLLLLSSNPFWNNHRFDDRTRRFYDSQTVS